MIKITSWNINSIRLRLPLLQSFIKQENPDIICLQETKVQDSEFPVEKIKNLGFEYISFSGQKSYNGVAIISKIPLYQVKKYDILNYGHKRHISALLPNNILLYNFYVPAGGDIADISLNDKFAFKLKFLDWMAGYFSNNYCQIDKIIMTGDMNIAPLENDVWSHKQLMKVVSHTPIEIEKMNILQESLNWIDSHRFFIPEKEKLYSWWSYRAKEPLISNKGRRLDHIWITPALKEKLKSVETFPNFRIKDKPSDHIPITTILDF